MVKDDLRKLYKLFKNCKAIYYCSSLYIISATNYGSIGAGNGSGHSIFFFTLIDFGVLSSFLFSMFSVQS